MGLFDRLKEGLSRTRDALSEAFYLGGEIDEDFWEELEDRLVMADMGATVAASIVDDLRDIAAREAISNSTKLKAALAKRIAQEFYVPEKSLLSDLPQSLVFVGINGAGKTTTVGKIAGLAKAQGKSCIIGAADTFRAAAIEQLEVWAKRAGVEIIERDRGADPASVCFEVLEKAEAENSDLCLIDTAGRLHTSAELMRELAKVVSVSRKRSSCPVKVILVIDASNGQNALVQANEFNEALELDGVILTKLDGTAKGGIAAAISSQLKLPIYYIGVGEAIEDLQEFDAQSFAEALVGTEV